MGIKKILLIVLGLLTIIVVSFIIGLLVGQRNVPQMNLLISKSNKPISMQEIKDKVTTIEFQTMKYTPETEIKKYTLNQEEMNVIFNIIENLTFSKETCDGFPKYDIRYNSEEKEGFVSYGLETYDKEYHITCNCGEAKLSDEQREQIDNIINKLDK